MTHTLRELPRTAPHIQLQHELGRGAMGSVWAAHHRDFGDVAVKLLDPKLVAEVPEVCQRLQFEAEAAWCIESPHIVTVHERGVAEGAPYLVMERLFGVTLESRLDEQGALPISECVWILEQMGWALAAAHAHGIVHRDLKPENVFLCGQDLVPYVKLLDFGIAKRPTSTDIQLTRPGAVLGTPYYMSREQLLCSAEVDHRADLWAFAVVAYEVLTGTVPFEGDNLSYLVRSVFEGRFRPVSELRPELVDSGCARLVDAWFARAFDTDIECRFETVGDMVSALRAVLPQDLDDEVSGIRRIVRERECGTTACWHPDIVVDAVSCAPPGCQSVVGCQTAAPPARFAESEPTAADIPMRSWHARMMMTAAAAGAVLGSLAALV